MRRRAFTVVLGATLLGACAPGGPPPSLQPRTAEAIDPRLPVERPINDRPVNAALAARLADLVAQARSGDAAFQPLAAKAEQLAGGADGRESESWVVAQQALTAAIAAREPTARALGDIDDLGATRLQTQGGLAPADFAAIKNAGNEVGAIDERQARTIKSIQQRLGL